MSILSLEPIQILQDKLAHSFGDEALLKTALTHSSIGEDVNNERLEFLGDRVLGLAVSNLLYERFPDESEGALAQRFNALVQKATLADIARDIDLADSLAALGLDIGGDISAHDSILADAMEALLGALYLDAGFPACLKAIRSLWLERLDMVEALPREPKTALQEWAQARGLPLPHYEITDKTGPDHAPEFEITVTVKGVQPMVATGPSRRLAEKSAAFALLQYLDNLEQTS